MEENYNFRGEYTLRYAKISTFDTANGNGIRTVLWVQGCSHGCVGCHNPGTWSLTEGMELTEDVLGSMYKTLEPSYIAGITYSGGDPLHLMNRNKVTEIAKYIRENYPNKTQWLYTGYKWNEIKDLEIIQYLDVLVDGEFEIDKRNLMLDYCGSENQRVIDVKKTLRANKIILWRNNEDE